MKPLMLVIVMSACIMYLLLHNTDKMKEHKTIHVIKNNDTAVSKKDMMYHQTAIEEMLLRYAW